MFILILPFAELCSKDNLQAPIAQVFFHLTDAEDAEMENGGGEQRSVLVLFESTSFCYPVKSDLPPNGV